MGQPIETAPNFTSRRARREVEEAARRSAKRRSARPSQEPRAAKPADGRRAPRIRAARSPKRAIAQALSVAALLGVFGLFVATSVPASAFYTPEQIEALAETGETNPAAAALSATSLGAGEIAEPQKVVVNAKAAQAAAETTVVQRDEYRAQAFTQQITNLRGNANYGFTNNPYGTIQWPFVSSVPISSGFGPRNVCSYCSTYHLGVDFTPGSGVPIQSIADGVVSAVKLDSGGLGNHVIIDHTINGQRVQSLYAHMQWGSITVAVGQQVAVGTVIGAVGNTGTSTGAHLHLEIHLDGTPVDPYAWLKANAN